MHSATRPSERTLINLIRRRRQPQAAAAAAGAATTTSSSTSNSTPTSQGWPRARSGREEAEAMYMKKLEMLRQKYMTNRAISDRAYYVLLAIYALFITFGTISNFLICLTVSMPDRTALRGARDFYCDCDCDCDADCDADCDCGQTGARLAAPDDR